MVKVPEAAVRRAGEKPTSGFALTCSLLSQYLKEKGGVGDLTLGIAAAAGAPLAVAGVPPPGKPEVPRTPRTMNLLPGVEAVEGGADASGGADSDGKKDSTLSMDLFPQRAGFGRSDEKKPDVIREAQRGQMTIFYGGKVVVFDNFPADKARELMAMAGRGCSTPAQGLQADQPASAPPQRQSCSPPAQHNSATTATLASNSEAKSAAAASPTPAATGPEAAQKPTQPPASDLPIARRVSLHRFLEKRKDRISAVAPYPASGTPAGATAKKPEERLQWLGLAPHASRA